MEAIIAVIGTLLGAAFGVAGSYVTQRVGHQRESRERLATVRRLTYVEYLTAVQDMFGLITELHKQERDGAITAGEMNRQLHQVSARNAQAALEHVRLISSGSVAAASAELWERMRRDRAPLGRGRVDHWREFTKWRGHYWDARHAFIDAARQDLGFPPLDWTSAGVGPAKGSRWASP